MGIEITIQSITDVISSLGFPIFVAIYLLVYTRKTLKSLEKAVTKLTEAITKITEKR